MCTYLRRSRCPHGEHAVSSSSGLLSMISPSIRPVLSFTTGCSLRVSRRRRTEQPARNAGSHRAQWAPDREAYETCGNMDRQGLTEDGRPVQRHAVSDPAEQCAGASQLQNRGNRAPDRDAEAAPDAAWSATCATNHVQYTMASSTRLSSTLYSPI